MNGDRYTREELGIRVAYLFIASALSGAFGGLIALGVLYMDGVNGWAGWRWYFPLPGPNPSPVLFSFDLTQDN